MQDTIDKKECEGRSQWHKNIGQMVALLFFVYFFMFCYAYSFKYTDAWFEYQQTEMHALTFQSTICRIERIITEEILSDQNKVVKTISIEAFFLLKVVNSTKTNDQFRVSNISLHREPGQHSIVSRQNTQLINTSVPCFYDPLGIEQARLTQPDVFTAKLKLGFWCFSVLVNTIFVLVGIPYIIMTLIKIIRERIQLPHQTTAIGN